jgi:hypothetical protein
MTPKLPTLAEAKFLCETFRIAVQMMNFIMDDPKLFRKFVDKTLQTNPDTKKWWKQGKQKLSKAQRNQVQEFAKSATREFVASLFKQEQEVARGQTKEKSKPKS